MPRIHLPPAARKLLLQAQGCEEPGCTFALLCTWITALSSKSPVPGAGWLVDKGKQFGQSLTPPDSVTVTLTLSGEWNVKYI